jgi:hypothetical protein
MKPEKACKTARTGALAVLTLPGTEPRLTARPKPGNGLARTGLDWLARTSLGLDRTRPGLGTRLGPGLVLD